MFYYGTNAQKHPRCFFFYLLPWQYKATAPFFCGKNFFLANYPFGIYIVFNVKRAGRAGEFINGIDAEKLIAASQGSKAAFDEIAGLCGGYVNPDA